MSPDIEDFQQQQQQREHQQCATYLFKKASRHRLQNVPEAGKYVYFFHSTFFVSTSQPFPLKRFFFGILNPAQPVEVVLKTVAFRQKAEKLVLLLSVTLQKYLVPA